MIELKSQFPSPEMLEQIAIALNIDTPELFSSPPNTTGNLKNLQRTVLKDVKKSLENAVEKAIDTTISSHIENIEKNEIC